MNWFIGRCSSRNCRPPAISIFHSSSSTIPLEGFGGREGAGTYACDPVTALLGRAELGFVQRVVLCADDGEVETHLFCGAAAAGRKQALSL